ncbi:B-cell receptor CD22-like [Mugil cephalus]|uniref:B-cell receptor CD22-like n=1 Tax=Mugil cephalus TaxID=48193 RepID=UPI001FB816F8|nr:B-cell receptor CD22-like [Mugil cephalus]
MIPSQPEDLRKDSQYSGRVQVLKPETGRSTLRITNLRESDSSEYRFKFKTPWFEWRSVLPGTTLTVTALQVQVTRIISVHQSQTEAELKCLSSCSPAGRLYVWFKNQQRIRTQQTSTLTDNFSLEDTVSCAFSGHEDYRSPSVYPSKLSPVSVSPSGEIVEGSSVTVTCRNDANPAAKYTWYKGNQPLPLGPGGIYHFTSISSEDRGIYYCKSEDQQSVSVFIDVQYPPKLPSVSVSPSGEIVEGSSVTLTCSSDANPAANYTWYKENEDSPKASGQNFTITDFRPEHRGSYYCEAQNRRGRHNSTLHRTFIANSWKFPVALSFGAVLLIAIILFLLLCFRRLMYLKQRSEIEQTPVGREETEEIHYASVQLATTQENQVYSNFTSADLRRYEEDCVYTAVRPSTRRSTGQAAVEDAVYSRVDKKHRV